MIAHALQRSRHGSGASTKSKRSDSFDNRSKKPSGGTTGSESPDVGGIFAQREEPWHTDLRVEFVEQYMQYLQSLGFATVQVRYSGEHRRQ